MPNLTNAGGTLRHQLTVNTPDGGLVRLTPREDSTNVRAEYLNTEFDSLEDHIRFNKAAQYLLMEGFVEYAGGQLDELLETPDWQTRYHELKDAIT